MESKLKPYILLILQGSAIPVSRWKLAEQTAAALTLPDDDCPDSDELLFSASDYLSLIGRLAQDSTHPPKAS